ncbi:MAG: glycosyltransferase [Pseudomonadota bacterium]
MTPPRVFFYVQHLLGIGHLARANRVAMALAKDGFDVSMVTGGGDVPGFPDASLRQITLPTVSSSDAGFSGLVDAGGAPVDEAFKIARRDKLIAAFEAVQPDIVITEAYPFGRRQMRFELIPLLERIAATRPKPLLFASIRDILQARTKPGRDAESADLVTQHFDGVLVHGDPGFARLEDTYPLAHQIAEKVHYTGLVAPSATDASEEQLDILVSAGGGAVGGAINGAALEAATILSETLRWVVVTGPNLPASEFDRLSRHADQLTNVTIQRFRTDFNALMSATRVSISQAGYNTVCDILRAEARSVLVPFAAGGETEQSVRAERLAARGRVSVIPEDELTSDALAEAITTELGRQGGFSQEANLEGANETARILRGLLGRQTGA